MPEVKNTASAATDVAEFISDLDGGQFERMLSIALSQSAAATVDMQAPNAEFARKCAQALGQRVHRVERIVDEVAV